MKTQQQQRCEGALWQGLGKTYRVFTVTFMGDHYGIVDDLVHNLLSHFISLQDPYSDTLVIGDDIEESDSATFSVITVCEESTMPATVCAEVSSTGEGSETVSFQSHSSQASIPEEEISICDPPRENRDKGDSTLTSRFHFKTKEFGFSTLKACSGAHFVMQALLFRWTHEEQYSVLTLTM